MHDGCTSDQAPRVAVVGGDIADLQALAKVTGQGQYTDDIRLPGMLHAAIATSTHAHARILGYDTTHAAAMPGVRAILTGADVPPVRHGGFIEDETLLAIGVVRYWGEPVAVVAADTPEQARAAARAIELRYDPLPAVLDAACADDPAMPPVHEEIDRYARRDHSAAGLHNTVARQRLREGDAEAALAAADLVLDDVFEVHAQAHTYLEPCSAVAHFDAGGKLTVWSSHQSLYKVQTSLAKLLALPASRVRVITPLVGGAFGGKAGLTVQPLAALLARVTGRPVRLTLSRSEDYLSMRTRHPARIRMRTGAMADGRLVARTAEMVFDGGAYAEDSAAVLGFAMLMARGPYRIEHVDLSGRVVYTNHLRAAGFRGFGNPQITFAGESQIDRIAEKLGRDPIDLRLQNAVRTGDRWVGGQELESCGFRQCLEAVRDASDWAARRQSAGADDTDPETMRGIGVAAVAHICGLMGSSAIVRMLEDGSVALSTGAVDLGQGSGTALAAICAEALGLPLDRINLSGADSDFAPHNWSTGGSRVTYMVGRAVLGAVAVVRRKILDQASEILEVSPEDLEIVPGGTVAVKGVPGMAASFAQIASRAALVAGGPIVGEDALVYDGEGFDPKRILQDGFPFARIGTFTFGAQAVAVTVDRVTGRIRPEAVWAAHDVGRAINAQAVRGQIEGGVVQGLGYALVERLAWDATGRPLVTSMSDYKIPGTLDVPGQLEAIIVEDPEPSGPFGAKGVGEPGIIGVAPALANAVQNAAGIRLRRLPLTPERVLDALEDASPGPTDGTRETDCWHR